MKHNLTIFYQSIINQKTLRIHQHVFMYQIYEYIKKANSINNKNPFKYAVNQFTKNISILWGTYRSLINNAVLGVTKGHEKNLELNGVGFRANLKGEELILSLGFSHEVKYKVPKGIALKIEKQTKIKITGTDKELVSKTASEIKSIKPVEPYKAKGIKEKNQYVIRKEGKKK